MFAATGRTITRWQPALTILIRLTLIITLQDDRPGSRPATMEIGVAVEDPLTMTQQEPNEGVTQWRQEGDNSQKITKKAGNN